VKFNNELLKKLVKHSGRTQKFFSLVCGVTETAFSRWVVGRAKPRVRNVIVLANYFEIKHNLFFKEVSN